MVDMRGAGSVAICRCEEARVSVGPTRQSKSFKKLQFLDYFRLPHLPSTAGLPRNDGLRHRVKLFSTLFFNKNGAAIKTIIFYFMDTFCS
jgi:hypothetical protein